MKEKYIKIKNLSVSKKLVSFINNVLTEKPYWFDQEGRYEHD